MTFSGLLQAPTTLSKDSHTHGLSLLGCGLKAQAKHFPFPLLLLAVRFADVEFRVCARLTFPTDRS